MVQIIEVGSPAFIELVEAIRLEVRITTERELRQKDRWLTTEDACAMLSITERTLARKRDEPNSAIEVAGKGKSLRYLESSLHKHMQKITPKTSHSTRPPLRSRSQRGKFL